MFRKEEIIEPDWSFGNKLKTFLAAHWRGIVIIIVPLIFLPLVLPLPGEKKFWCAYTLLIMALYWVLEVIPLAVTGFLPMVVFPLSGVNDSLKTCNDYISDAVIVFLASLMLACSIEQSGLHKRLAYFAIRTIGYSHAKLLMAMCIVTTFVSMWITNTAATSMMVPILFALLKVFEDEKIIVMFEKDADGNKVASDITTCYFCGATFSATCGGIGTLVGTGTNLAFKALFGGDYPDAPEYISFPNFSMFAVPYMVVLEFFTYIYMAIVYFGLFRPNSKLAKSCAITDKAKLTAQQTIERESAKQGTITFWEIMVVCLFGAAIAAFFSRSPQVFLGWGDLVIKYHGVKDKKFVKDSALAMMTCFAMFIFPSKLVIFKNFTAKNHESLPKKSVRSVLSWPELNKVMPYSFMFLLGGGVALSRGAKSSGLNDQLGEYMTVLTGLPNYLIIFFLIVIVVFITNFASNVAVINVFGPIAMTLARKMGVNPLWYIVAAGFSASYCFMLAVGTPGNVIVKSVAYVPVLKMMKAGFGPTVSTLIFTWIAMCFWAPVIWPDMRKPIKDLKWIKD